MSIKTSYNPQQVRMLKSFRRLFDAKWKSICKLNNYQNEEELENDADNFFPKVIVNCRYNNEIQNGRSQKGISPSTIKLKMTTTKRNFPKFYDHFIVHIHVITFCRIIWITYSSCIQHNPKKKKKKKTSIGELAQKMMRQIKF